MHTSDLQEIINKTFGPNIQLRHYTSVGGGCINHCYRLQTSDNIFFVKCNSLQYLDMFEKEHRGLSALSSLSELKVPIPLGTGVLSGRAYLIMEYLEPTAISTEFFGQLGRGLARMHKNTQKEFGWNEDNYIGRLPQVNSLNSDWIDFFISQRLVPQIARAVDQKVLPNKERRELELLLSKLHNYLVTEAPAFIHGDLWSGNIMSGPGGLPCLLDPAVYYGHREVEMAFTTLFGGFDAKFYQSYSEVFPLQRGYHDRFEIYNLYPLLVHLNLFGGGYLSSIVQVISRYA